MRMAKRFHQVDVFGARPLRGNPLAVVHDAEDLSDGQMSAFARWTHLSETTFLLPPTDPTADYRVRIFTPGGELPFAGHPTLGTCFSWLAAGGRPKREGEVVQQCAVGLVRVRRHEERRLAFAAPPITVEPVDAALLDRVCKALGLPTARLLCAAWLSSGFPQLALELDSAQAVLSLKPDHQALKALPKVGVVGRYPAGSECDVEVRFFVASIGIDEDPVTGSLNANLGHWLMADGRMPRRYVASQGTAVQCEGRVYLEHDGQTLWVGGDVDLLVEGRVAL
ncbi:MAG TPA: PhzF family phenazine biosynthesis protein [Burkholderiaceae bacterium]|nr:PhzF family phenazine biosynthesis protein [Burkholderiaceae bacterium]